MNTFTTNMNTNPLRVALIISMLLHLIGFYFLSNYSFNSTLRTPKITPITVRTLVEKKGIQAMGVKHATQQNPIQSVHLPKLASNELNNIFHRAVGHWVSMSLLIVRLNCEFAGYS